MKKITYSILLVILVLFVVSCGSSPEKMIIGKWEDPMTGESMEFFKDGTVVEEEDTFGRSTGTYKFVDERHIKFIYFFGEVIAEITFLSKNELAISTSFGKTFLYRVKRKD